MLGKYIVLLIPISAYGIYPYFDTQDFIYNVPKVYRISLTLDKLLGYYEKKPSKDPEFHIALGLARGQLEYVINELDASVPNKLKENLQNITRRMDRIRNKTDSGTFVYRSKDYEYDACMMQLLISAMETQTTQTDGSCELSPECSSQIMQGSGLAFQQTSRVRALILARIFDCMEAMALSSLVIYIRALLETDQAFQYDVLT
ncbi:unnamed protein product [Leptidea sinapis]|uniref:Uncharacterized protein n=1 Tax=Leptidea sinapis TaxID=189913 RepID=A0A5E4QYE9_9NEOP|nr:unnamed protein product [Leptidea sinapis]